MSDLLPSIWEWGKENGPFAAMLVLSNAFWVWFLLRLRKEGKATYKELSALVGEKEDALAAEKDARREEALSLQAKGYESISKLVQLMDRVEEVLKRVESSMLVCLRNQRRE